MENEECIIRKKIDIKKLCNINRKRIVQYIFTLLNIAAALFYVIYGAVGNSTAAGNIFGVLAIIIICADVCYCVVSKTILSFYTMLCFALGILFNHLGIFNLSPNTANSMNFLAVIPTALMPILFIIMQFFEITELQVGDKIKQVDKIIKLIFKIVAPIVLFVLCLFAYDSVFNYGESNNEYTTTRAAFMFAFVAFVIIAVIIKIYLFDAQDKISLRIKKSGIHVLLCSVIGIFTVSAFIAPYIMIPNDIANANNQYVSAFGSESLNKSNGERNIPFNFADRFAGIKTDNYATDNDIIYLNDNETGLTLRYDAYLPANKDAHKSILIYIHGRNGDKGNSVEKCKYFAGQGYVVFDLQVGDSREKNINYVINDHPSYDYMINNIYEFIKYASSTVKYGENWQSVFISGGSMGGGITLEMNFLNNRFEELGITVKGILPIYPTINDLINVETVRDKALPCLMLMGTHDGFVETWKADELKAMYTEAGNKQIAIVWISYAGHGCDAIFADRASQIFTYYAECFMRKYR